MKYAVAINAVGDLHSERLLNEVRPIFVEADSWQEAVSKFRWMGIVCHEANLMMLDGRWKFVVGHHEYHQRKLDGALLADGSL